MKFDDILHEIGDFGPYQRRIYAIVCAIAIPTSWMTLVQVFAMASTDHWCQVPKWNKTVCEDYGYSEALCNVSNHEMNQKTVNIPFAENDFNKKEFEKCFRYKEADYSRLNTMESVSVNKTSATYSPLEKDWSRDNDTVPCDSGWDYDRGMFTRTVIQEYDLVCSRDKYIQYSQAVYYLGYLVGSVLFGILADRYGRYPVLMVLMIMTIVFGYAHLLFHNYWAFTFIRFCQGLGNISRYITAFVIGTEFVGTSKRNVAGMLIMTPYAIGYMILAGIAYLVRDWRMLMVAITTPQLLLFIGMIYLPESARWLVSRGETEKAKKIIRKAAKVNGVTLNEEILSDNSLLDKEEICHEEKRGAPLDLFRHPNLRRRTLMLMYIWAVCALVYHGFNLSTSTLGINVFISFMVSGAMEIPATFVCIVIIEHAMLGRRRSLTLMLLVGGVSCLITVFLAPGPLRAAIGMVGKFGISSSFAILYLYTGELYPTPLRNMGIGFCSMASRVANILAPLILLTRHYWEPAPLVIFGTTTCLAALLAIFLPETRGMKLPENIEEGENLGRMKRLEDMNANASSDVEGKYVPETTFGGSEGPTDNPAPEKQSKAEI